MLANDLRTSFLQYFASKGHRIVESASLVPDDPTVMFTIAGMVPFKPYFTGEQPAPFPRAASVQKCFRTLDIDVVGTTSRHCTFFEMLGNFSFGDYFKDDAIPFAWGLVTEVLGMKPERLWVTIYQDDDEAESIWTKKVGLPTERVQRMGDENFWKMGDQGPCGPSSEIYYDRGEHFGAGGGPALGGSERYVEIWNLVFMQYNRMEDGSLAPLPRKSIDTGAGLERILPILEGKESLFDTELFSPLISRAEEMCGLQYGTDEQGDVTLRILADHARAAAFLISDGVLPSNEGRGHILRRVMRRAIRRAFNLGVEQPVLKPMVETVSNIMAEAYPQLLRDIKLIEEVVSNEEEQFRRTLSNGGAILEAALAEHPSVLSGEVAFRLHDTYGFPIELTKEIAAEQGVSVDMVGFEQAMAEQRNRARLAAKQHLGSTRTVSDSSHITLLDHFGPTYFTGYNEYVSNCQVIGVVPTEDPSLAEVFLDRTPFYPEGGGQVGDVGTITTETGTAHVINTTYAIPGLIAHHARIEGQLMTGQSGVAVINGPRRDAIMRNHTATHLLHWALRQVLGEHVRQQGSLVAEDHLRFDFNHGNQLVSEELEAISDLINSEVLTDAKVRTFETTKQEADRLGAIAFFGEKYHDVVRVVEAGEHSIELCAGTHVPALGMIGPVAIVQEGSIGSGTRRVEAVSGTVAISTLRSAAAALERVASMLQVDVDSLPNAIERMLERERATAEELKKLRERSRLETVEALANKAVNGVVIARQDGEDQASLRELALLLRDRPGIHTAVLIGVPNSGSVVSVVATKPSSGLDAASIVRKIGVALGGGGGGSPQLAMAGGRDPSKIDLSIEIASKEVGL